MRRLLPGLLWLSVTTAAATTVGAAVRMAVHRVDGGAVPVMEAKASPTGARDVETTITTTPPAPSTEVAAAPVRATVTSSTSASTSSQVSASPSRRTSDSAAAAATTTTTRAARPTSTTPPAPAPTTTTTASPPSTTTTVPVYTYEAQGGTVAVQCNASDVSMVYANPARGYGATVDSSGPRVVDVTFDSHGHHSEIRVTCIAGAPQPTVTERGS